MTEATSEEKVSTNSSPEDRIAVLKEKHALLESALNDETSRPMPDSAVLANIKREKLAIKDELERLTQ